MIVSTSRGLYDLKEKKFIIEDNGPYFGVAKDSNNCIYAARRGTSDVIILDKNYKKAGSIDTPTCVDAHGLEIYNNKVYILSTKSNDIIQADLQSRMVEKIFRNTVGNKNPHMNSIEKIGELLFIMSHRDNFTNSSCIHLFSPEINRAFRFFNDLGEHCHTIKYYNSTFWYCDSFNSRVASVDGDSIEIDSSRLVRGMALQDNKLYVGLSEKASRADRHDSVDGEVVVFDFKSKKYIESIKIKNCGQVNEILLH